MKARSHQLLNTCYFAFNLIADRDADAGSLTCSSNPWDSSDNVANVLMQAAVLQIKTLFDDEVVLAYMEEVGDGLFRWPVRPDVSQERL